MISRCYMLTAGYGQGDWAWTCANVMNTLNGIPNIMNDNKLNMHCGSRLLELPNNQNYSWRSISVYFTYKGNEVGLLLINLLNLTLQIDIKIE